MGKKCGKTSPLFDAFYREEFQQAKAFCGQNPKAREVVAACKKAGYPVVLATNPIFPAVATESRIRWAGLEPEDFAWYTTYENIGYSKPNPAYYQHILTRLGAQAEDCLMVGNDVNEDMGAAQQAGLSVFSPHRLPDQPGGKGHYPLPSGGLRCPDGLCSVLGVSVQRYEKLSPIF